MYVRCINTKNAWHLVGSGVLWAEPDPDDSAFLRVSTAEGALIGSYLAHRFQPCEAPQATTPAPTPPGAAVAPAGGLAGGVKHDGGKPRMDLLPPEALREIAAVLAMGAEKYDAHNWRRGFAYSRLIAAALRHLFAWVGGENKDPESGKSHLAHAACCLMFLITFEQTRTGTDDRHTK